MCRIQRPMICGKLRPDIYFHGPAGLIVFDVFPSTMMISNPAPTLEKRLHELWYREMEGGGDPTPLASQALWRRVCERACSSSLV